MKAESDFIFRGMNENDETYFFFCLLIIVWKRKIHCFGNKIHFYNNTRIMRIGMFWKWKFTWQPSLGVNHTLYIRNWANNSLFHFTYRHPAFFRICLDCNTLLSNEVKIILKKCSLFFSSAFGRLQMLSVNTEGLRFMASPLASSLSNSIGESNFSRWNVYSVLPSTFFISSYPSPFFGTAVSSRSDMRKSRKMRNSSLPFFSLFYSLLSYSCIVWEAESLVLIE